MWANSLERHSMRRSGRAIPQDSALETAGAMQDTGESAEAFMPALSCGSRLSNRFESKATPPLARATHSTLPTDSPGKARVFSIPFTPNNQACQ